GGDCRCKRKAARERLWITLLRLAYLVVAVEAARCATMSALIFSYTDRGIIFLLTSSFLARYGLPSMIFCEYFSPMPGNASSCSLVAALMSSFSLLAAEDLLA